MKYSIITINKNNATGLKDTLQSIIDQDNDNYEIIVIDGASSDHSIEIIKTYNDHISFWSSEPDKGIYDGMNKGIKKASGDYILFLNSGDIFHSKTVLSKVNQQNKNRDFIFGSTLLKCSAHTLLITPPSEMSFYTFFSGGVCHQSSFIKRELFCKYGSYDTSYSIVADWIFFIDMLFKRNSSYMIINTIISIFDTNGISSSQKQKEELQRQRLNYLTQEFPLFIKDFKLYSKLRRILFLDIKTRLKYKLFNFKNRFL